MDFPAHGQRKLHPAALDDDVDVVAGAAEETVAHIAADDERTNAHLPRGLGNDPEYRPVKVSFRYRLHNSSYGGSRSSATTPSPSRL